MVDSIIGSLPEIFYMLDEEARFVRWNTSLEDISEYSPEELLRLDPLDMFIEEDRELVAERIAEVFAAGRSSVEATARTKSGREIGFYLTGVLTEIGGKSYIIGTGMDITELRQARETLMRNEERFRALIEKASDAITIVDADGTMRYVSPSNEHVMGRSPEDTAGRNMIELVHPDDLERLMETFPTLLGEPGGTTSDTYRSLHGDGSWRWIEATATNLINDPKVGGIVVNYRDITERVEAEAAAEHSRKYFESIINLCSEGIVVMNSDMTIGFLSDTARSISGYVGDIAVSSGTLGFDFIHPEDIPKVTEIFMDALQDTETGRPRFVELRASRPDGTWQWFEIVVTNLVGNPDVQGMVVNLRDLTERKEAEEALKKYAGAVAQSNDELYAAREELAALNHDLERRVVCRTAEVERLLEQKNGFIRQLGHDLKSPLTPLVTLLPIIREDEKEPDQQELLDSVMQNVEYIRELVDKTLKLAKLNTNASLGAPGTVNLSDQIESLLRARRSTGAVKGIEIDSSVQADIVIEGDELGVEELLDNLLSNAMKFTPPGGTITMDAETSEQFVTVSIRDSGIGMSEDQLSHVWDEFYKADPSRHELESSGLGLPICRRIVEQHGGKIWAESEGLDKGSAFHFTLKLAEADSSSGEGQN
jgi:PAS domain S-box-containing protein